MQSVKWEDSIFLEACDKINFLIWEFFHLFCRSLGKCSEHFLLFEILHSVKFSFHFVFIGPKKWRVVEGVLS